MTEMTISEPASKRDSTREIPIYEFGDLKEQNLIYQENKHLLQTNIINPSIKVSERSSAID